MRQAWVRQLPRRRQVGAGCGAQLPDAGRRAQVGRPLAVHVEGAPHPESRGRALGAARRAPDGVDGAGDRAVRVRGGPMVCLV